MKIALAHDSFTQLGGAERVIEGLHEMYPDAPVYTLVFDRKFKEKYQGWDIRTSWLQILYNFIPKLQYLFPFIPLAVSFLDFLEYDLVISSSSSWIKNIKVPKNCVHVNYCHTPTRFLWIDKDYVNQEAPSIIRPAAKFVVNLMKNWDYKGAQRVTYFIANSSEVQKRIQRVYQRTSTVIYPCINTDFWKPTKTKQDYFLIAGRLQAHKHNDLIIEIFNELSIPLHVVGTGRQETHLKSIAKENIKFLGRIPDEQLREEYSGALGYIFPQLEDFGLMPLEAAACGTSTLGLGQGGNLETIVPGITGEFFADYNKEKIKKMILDWNLQKYQTDILLAHAAKFSKEKFKQKIVDFLQNV